MSLDPELVVEPKRRGRTRSPKKPKAKAEPKPTVAAIEAPQPKAEPKSKAEPKAIPKSKPKPQPAHGVELLENKDKKYWEKQNVTVLKQQAELRGYRFSDVETKGVEQLVKRVKQTVKKFKKKDYLQVLLKLLKI